MMTPTIAKIRQKERQKQRREQIAVEMLGKLIVSPKKWELRFGEEGKVITTMQHVKLAVVFADNLIEILDKND